MRCFVMLLLLATALAAWELSWDDKQIAGGNETVDASAVAVLFCDSAEGGPGDTGGRPGCVSAFTAKLQGSFWFNPPVISLYERDGDNPGAVIAEDIDYYYTYNYDWYIFSIPEPVRVPGDFFAVIELPDSMKMYDDATHTWAYPHSRIYDGGQWAEWETDLRLRVWWEPSAVGNSRVEEGSWGAIKIALHR